MRKLVGVAGFWNLLPPYQSAKKHRTSPSITTGVPEPVSAQVDAAVPVAVVATPVAGEGQQTAKVYRIGYLGEFSVDEVLRPELRVLGYVEGQNLVIEGRFHQGKPDRYPALVISAAVILEDPAYLNGRAQLAALALRYRLAVVFPFSDQARAGGLMSYGADFDEVSRRAAGFVERILKELGPRRFPSVLARADEIVQ